MMSSAAVLAAPVTTIGGGSNYAVGWFTLSLINAGLAQTKNRSALAWWAISLLLGPLATLVIVSPVRAR